MDILDALRGTMRLRMGHLGPFVLGALRRARLVQHTTRSEQKLVQAASIFVQRSTHTSEGAQKR